MPVCECKIKVSPDCSNAAGDQYLIERWTFGVDRPVSIDDGASPVGGGCLACLQTFGVPDTYFFKLFPNEPGT